ncbi:MULTISPECIES: type IV secretory system conjugative DNA transfer family protein [Aeromonas]|uniref:Type IV secretion system protein DotC n=1 Tax=Aeromonas veronii TaxID=654 RepID=A0A4S5CDT4_AERVE|nr:MULTISPECIES: type IV secretory system conjugative DNA transfer family protein [Aeromonas]THJ43659.1 hypothetical protein E8Q35_15245 [Aeromonas veronii]
MKIKPLMLFVVAVLSAPSFADSSGRYEKKHVDGKAALQSLMAENISRDEEAALGLVAGSEWEKAIESTAFTLGVQSGAQWQAKNVQDFITANQRIYDAGINFDPLLIKQKNYSIQPPVISEDNGRNIISESGRVLRILDKTFQINIDSKFVYGAKSWREYLYVVPDEPVIPNRQMRPKNERENQIWNASLKRGWEVGVKSVEYTMKTRYARLIRDYVGMTRYHVLRHYNMVSLPEVSESYKAVTGNGQVMNVGDRVLTIKALPNLNLDKQGWIAISRLPQTAGLFPRGIEDQSISMNEMIGYAGHLQPKL